MPKIFEPNGGMAEMKVVQGRNFSREFGTDVDAVIKKSAEKYMGLENPVREFWSNLMPG
jgi:hypothetical protein